MRVSCHFPLCSCCVCWGVSVRVPYAHEHTTHTYTDSYISIIFLFFLQRKVENKTEHNSPVFVMCRAPTRELLHSSDVFLKREREREKNIFCYFQQSITSSMIKHGILSHSIVVYAKKKKSIPVQRSFGSHPCLLKMSLETVFSLYTLPPSPQR